MFFTHGGHTARATLEKHRTFRMHQAQVRFGHEIQYVGFGRHTLAWVGFRQKYVA